MDTCCYFLFGFKYTFLRIQNTNKYHEISAKPSVLETIGPIACMSTWQWL